MPDLESVNALLVNIASAVERIEEAEAMNSKEHAHRFDPFAYLRIDELGICRIIADLLKPNGDHGQRDLFLKEFLAICGLPISGTSRAFVRTEQRTAETEQIRRRTDIYIELDDSRVVAIEAKPYIDESPDQFGNMMRDAEKRASRVSLPGAAFGVFLTRDGREPTSIEHEQLARLRTEGRLILLRFDSDEGQSVRNWIDNCAAAQMPDRLRWFLSEFSRHLTKCLRGSTNAQGESAVPDHQLVAHLLSLSKEKRVSAFHLADAGDALRKAVWFNFIESLRDLLKGIDRQFVIETDAVLQDPRSAFERPNNYPTLYWRRPDWPSETGIALEISSARPLRNVELVLGFRAASTRVHGGQVADHSRVAVWDAVRPRLEGSRVIRSLKYDPEWWPVRILPTEPLDKPFTPEGLTAISESDAVEAIAECFRAIYEEVTNSVRIEALG